jgi:8-oxo-dGTP diphosphatase
MQKRVAAGAIIRNHRGDMLIVKPTYKEGWLIPGGMATEDELPTETCIREVKEELNISIKPGKLLAVDFVQNRSKAILFVFDGGILTKKQIASILLPPKELSAFKFVPENEALKLLRPRNAERVPKIMHLIKTASSLYFESKDPYVNIGEK